MKRIVSVIICAVLITIPMCFGAFAESGKAAEKAEVSVSNTTGNPGDTIFVPIVLSSNPGIADFALTLDFDKSVLKYKGYHAGVPDDYAVYDRAAKGNVALVSLNEKNVSKNGNIVVFEFDVSKKAKEGSYKFSLSKTQFFDKNGKSVKANTENGSLKISKACAGEHVYSGWKSIVSKTCTKDGISLQTCQNCGHTETKTVFADGHTLDSTFTVDVIAQGKKSGMLSRHCRTCGAKTNIIIYNEKNTAALTINDIAKELDDSSLANLIYFLNGSRSYPDITDDHFDINTIIKSGNAPLNENGEINIASTVDRVLRRLFGNNKKGGLFGALRRAALADEIPLKLIKKLILLAFC